MRRTYQYQLKPTTKQKIVLQAFLDSQRSLYNWALEERKTAWEERKQNITLAEQSRSLPAMKKTPEWEHLARFSAGASQETLKRLDRAFESFYRRVNQGQTPGYPRFRGAGWFNTIRLDTGKGGVIWDSQYTGRNHATNRGLRKKKSTITLYVQGVGHIKVNQHRPLGGVVKTIDITRRSRGRWVVSVSCVGVEQEILAPTGREVGIDLGVTEFISTSDGELIPNPRYMKNQATKVAEAQRALSKKQLGSLRRSKAKLVLSKLKEKERLQRQDYHRKVSHNLIQHADVIYAEDLNVKNMLEKEGKYGKNAKKGLNRSINDAGWRQFITYLTNKAESAGRSVVLVNPAYTSQYCRECGHTSPDNRKGVRFNCVECGFTGHADVLAAMNIRDRGQGLTSLDKVSC